jgi:predicted transglutaminase-like protease
MKNKDLMEGMEGVELTDEQLLIERTAQAEEHNNLIKDLSRKEEEIRVRMKTIQDEIDSYYAQREEKVKEWESLTKEKLLDSIKIENEARDFRTKYTTALEELNADKDNFEIYRADTKKSLEEENTRLVEEAESLKRYKIKLDQRLENLVLRETFLHQIGG